MRAANANTHLPPAPGLPHLPKPGGATGLSIGSPAARPGWLRPGYGAPIVCAAPAVLLACGNPLRQDDGVGWRIAEAMERTAERAFPVSRLRIIAVQQWTPELAEDLAGAELAIFVDASATDEAGAIRVRPVEACAEPAESHGLEPAGLLALARQVRGHAPARAFLLTVGAESFHYGEEISGRVQPSVPRAVRLVGNLVAAFAAEA
jgi:hydrogenase maturation protease